MTIQDEITAQTIKSVKQAQDVALSTINIVADRVSPLIPKTDSIPYLDKLPKPQEIVEKAFDLSSVLLASAKTIAVEATKAFTPQPKTAAKPTPKAAAKAAAETSASTN